jgi:DNA polymerase-3 subunit delta'
VSYDAIRGHAAALRILRHAVTSGRIGSGYLFYGPEGVGKSLVAREFARAILCPDGGRTGAACDSCPPCTRSRSGSHPGLVVVEREENRTRIRLEQIQGLTEVLSLRPLEGESKVAVLPEMEWANEEAMNALLKTLEEPPPRTTLVLVTSNREAAPETIRSRCQGVRFGPLGKSAVEEILAAREELDPERARELAALAAGAPGRALRLLALGYPEKARETADLLARGARPGGDPVETARLLTDALAAGGLADRRERVREALTLLVEHVRQRFLSPGAGPRDPGRADRCLKELSRSLRDLSLNVTPDSVLRSALVRVLPELSGPVP